jgi:stress-induced morphogen
MADAALKRKIKALLRTECFNDPDDAVFVSDGSTDETIHVVVVSEKFEGRGLREKTQMILQILTDSLSRDEWGRVTLCIGRVPEELKVS